MRFYYFSIFSWMAYGLYVVVVLGAMSAVWTRVLKRKLSNPLYILLAATIIAAPWIEEVAIANNFDKQCSKDAGVAIDKVVNVEGFYDDTTHWWRQLSESEYEFVESKDYVYKTLWRAERANGEIRHFQIDKPTARYRYMRVNDHVSAGHQVWRFEDTVVDTQTNETIGRYVNYARGPYWFFIHVDAPVLECQELKGKDPIVYRQVLKPAK